MNRIRTMEHETFSAEGQSPKRENDIFSRWGDARELNKITLHQTEERSIDFDLDKVEVVPMETAPNGRAYTVEEIGAILRIGRTSAYNLVKQKHFSTVYIGKNIRISRKSFDDWFENQHTRMAVD